MSPRAFQGVLKVNGLDDEVLRDTTVRRPDYIRTRSALMFGKIRTTQITPDSTDQSRRNR